MKYLSNNFIMLILALVLSFSPVQVAFSAASKCMMMEDNMHSQMDVINKNNSDDSNNKADCCSQNECATSHCINVPVVSNASNDFNNVIFQVSSAYQKRSVTLIPFYSSSLYRPPKI